MMPTILAFGMPGPGEMLFFGAIALLIFGNRLPGVAKSLGKSIVEFKKGIAGIEEDIDSAVTADKKPVASPTTTSPTSQPSTHE
jgi:sec-independent protein translocase protein TatA